MLLEKPSEKKNKRALLAHALHVNTMTIGAKIVAAATAMALSTAKSRTCLTLAKKVELICMAEKVLA